MTMIKNCKFYLQELDSFFLETIIQSSFVEHSKN